MADSGSRSQTGVAYKGLTIKDKREASQREGRDLKKVLGSLKESDPKDQQVEGHGQRQDCSSPGAQGWTRAWPQQGPPSHPTFVLVEPIRQQTAGACCYLSRAILFEESISLTQGILSTRAKGEVT